MMKIEKKIEYKQIWLTIKECTFSHLSVLHCYICIVSANYTVASLHFPPWHSIYLFGLLHFCRQTYISSICVMRGIITKYARCEAAHIFCCGVFIGHFNFTLTVKHFDSICRTTHNFSQFLNYFYRKCHKAKMLLMGQRSKRDQQVYLKFKHAVGLHPQFVMRYLSSARVYKGKYYSTPENPGSFTVFARIFICLHSTWGPTNICK